MDNKFLNSQGINKILNSLKEKLASKKSVEQFEEDTKTFVTNVEYFDVINDLIFDQDVVPDKSEWELSGVHWKSNTTTSVSPSLLEPHKQYVLEVDNVKVTANPVGGAHGPDAFFWLGVNPDTGSCLIGMDQLNDCLYITHSSFTQLGASYHLKIYQPALQ